MRSVRVKRNLVYKRAGGSDLQMDVYSPKTSRGRLPAVIFVHGGRIPPNLLTTPKDWAVHVSFGELVAASGFVGVTFNHRFHTWESLADSQTDVMNAIKYVRDQAATLAVDPDRIVFVDGFGWGHILKPAIAGTATISQVEYRLLLSNGFAECTRFSTAFSQ